MPKLLMFTLFLALLHCGDDQDVLRVTPATDFSVEDLTALDSHAVNQILKNSLYILPATATADLQTRALISYLGGAFKKGQPQSLTVADVLAEGKTTPYVAVALAYHAARALGWEPRVLVLACAPGTVWLIEVNTEDGRFLLDPFQRAIATRGGPFSEALRYPDAFSNGTWFAAAGPWPPASFGDFIAAWQPLPAPAAAAQKASFKNACTRGFYDAERAVEFPIVADMQVPALQWGKKDASPWDIDALFASSGETRSDHAFLGGFHSPAGPVVISHRLELISLVPGKRYRYTYEEADLAGNGYLVALSNGVRLGDWVKRSERSWSVDFVAERDSASLQLGFGNAGRMTLDWFSVTELP